MWVSPEQPCLLSQADVTVPFYALSVWQELLYILRYFTANKEQNLDSAMSDSKATLRTAMLCFGNILAVMGEEEEDRSAVFLV